MLSHVFLRIYYGNNSFTEAPKNLARYKSENIFVIGH